MRYPSSRFKVLPIYPVCTGGHLLPTGEGKHPAAPTMGIKRQVRNTSAGEDASATGLNFIVLCPIV
jgi:hypothetical protein